MSIKLPDAHPVEVPVLVLARRISRGLRSICAILRGLHSVDARRMPLPVVCQCVDSNTAVAWT